MKIDQAPVVIFAYPVYPIPVLASAFLFGLCPEKSNCNGDTFKNCPVISSTGQVSVNGDQFMITLMDIPLPPLKGVIQNNHFHISATTYQPLDKLECPSQWTVEMAGDFTGSKIENGTYVVTVEINTSVPACEDGCPGQAGPDPFIKEGTFTATLI